ncbi:MAG: diacylglycerol kinase [Candidatus Omnitrophica bacterium]|jgi:diacylglycerol kinase|nr:diacylglycerol kinase [Candidatus Omnitrophota bacterium]
MIRRPWRHRNLLESFIGAFRGLVTILRHERYTKLVGFSGVLIILFAVILNVSLIEIAILVTTITIVLLAEIFNAAIENVLNILKPYRDHHVKVLKEVSAGMVLLASFGAAITGCLILLPKIILVLK